MDDTAKSYAYLNWLNCRLTAFSLIQNVVETSKDGGFQIYWLMFDVGIQYGNNLRHVKKEKGFCHLSFPLMYPDEIH